MALIFFVDSSLMKASVVVATSCERESLSLMSLQIEILISEISDGIEVIAIFTLVAA